MSWFYDDVRQAWRGLVRRPGFSALAVLALAVGLGVNTIAFSAVNALLYKPFRFEHADRAGWLFVGTRRDSLQTSTLATFEAIAGHARTVERLAAQGRVPLAFRQGGATEEIWALVVSGDYFEIVPVTPVPAGSCARATDGAARRQSSSASVSGAGGSTPPRIWPRCRSSSTVTPPRSWE